MTAAAMEPVTPVWSEEPAARPDRIRIRARIGGLHCSLCTGTIEKALGRHAGVDKVAVSLTHEQALIEYDPKVARPEELLQTLRDIGYSVSDPRKLRPFEEEERDLVREGRRFLAATALSLIAIALIAHPAGVVLPAVCRPAGRRAKGPCGRPAQTGRSVAAGYPPAAGAFGRRAAARGDCPGAGQQSAAHPGRRAHRKPRFQGRQAAWQCAADHRSECRHGEESLSCLIEVSRRRWRKQ